MTGASDRGAASGTASGFAGSLVLVCPGLLGPIPALPSPPIETPAIGRLLARADPLSVAPRDPIEALLKAVGIAIAAGQDAPSGAICLLGTGHAVGPGEVWMHADPVHLRPDRDRLLVYAGPGVEPDRDETQALLETFNRHFSADGLWLVAPTPGAWYLRVDRALDLRTSPLHRAREASMAEHLPLGTDARDWMRLLNEAQMLFHGHAVNHRRESAGRPTISGLWTWGTGVLPAVADGSPQALIGDHPLILGLERLLARPRRTLQDWTEEPSFVQDCALVFWDRHWHALQARDLDAWARAPAELETPVAILEARLRSGGLRRILLDPCGDRLFPISSGQSRRFWRRGNSRRFLSIGPPA